MLLNFTVENWMSYRDEATFALTSSLERQHIETLSKVPGFRSKKALPVAAIYGGNASGKTGIFRAATIKNDDNILFHKIFLHHIKNLDK